MLSDREEMRGTVKKREREEVRERGGGREGVKGRQAGEKFTSTVG